VVSGGLVSVLAAQKGGFLKVVKMLTNYQGSWQYCGKNAHNAAVNFNYLFKYICTHKIKKEIRSLNKNLMIKNKISINHFRNP